MNIPDQLVEHWARAHKYDDKYILQMWKDLFSYHWTIGSMAYIVITVILYFVLMDKMTPVEGFTTTWQITITLVVVAILLTTYSKVGWYSVSFIFPDKSYVMIFNKLITDTKRLKKVAGVWRFKKRHFDISDQVLDTRGILSFPEEEVSQLATLCWKNIRGDVRSLKTRQSFIDACIDRGIRNKKAEDEVSDFRSKIEKDFDIMSLFGLRPKNIRFGELFSEMGPNRTICHQIWSS